MISIVCAIVKNEQRFIKEWAEHYLRIGFAKLFIFEDFGSDSHYEQLKELIDKKKVELTNLQTSNIIPHYEKGTEVQYNLYNYFLDRCRKERIADWCGFFDIDEFMMFEDGWNLNKIENEFLDKGGILLSWKNYGANGHIKRPEGNIVNNYTSYTLQNISDSDEFNVKSLVNVHRCGKQRRIHAFEGCCYTDGKSLQEGKKVYCRAWINHYFTKSWEDYLDRIFRRGNMHNNYRCLDLFFKCSPEFQKDKEAMIMSQRKKACASTMWISHEYKLISGGNEDRLAELTKKYVTGRKKIHKLCICQMIKDEHDYIEEWVEYNHSIGVERIYLIEDYNSRSHSDILSKYDYVELHKIEDIIDRNEEELLRAGVYKQKIIYSIFRRLWWKDNEWMMFIDPDEYIELEKNDLDLLLSKANSYPAITLHWKIMTASGHLYHPNNGNKYSIVDTYTESIPSNVTKLILNCSSSYWNILTVENFKHCPHRMENIKTFDRGVVLRHYLYKSFEEWVKRLTVKGEIKTSKWNRKFEDWFDANKEFAEQKEKLYDIFHVRSLNVLKNDIKENE